MQERTGEFPQLFPAPNRSLHTQKSIVTTLFMLTTMIITPVISTIITTMISMTSMMTSTMTATIITTIITISFLLYCCGCGWFDRSSCGHYSCSCWLHRCGACCCCRCSCCRHHCGACCCCRCRCCRHRCGACCCCRCRCCRHRCGACCCCRCSCCRHRCGCWRKSTELCQIGGHLIYGCCSVWERTAEAADHPANGARPGSSISSSSHSHRKPCACCNLCTVDTQG